MFFVHTLKPLIYGFLCLKEINKFLSYSEFLRIKKEESEQTQSELRKSIKKVFEGEKLDILSVLTNLCE